jgi:hypothetical protein
MYKGSTFQYLFNGLSHYLLSNNITRRYRLKFSRVMKGYLPQSELLVMKIFCVKPNGNV